MNGPVLLGLLGYAPTSVFHGGQQLLLAVFSIFFWLRLARRAHSLTRNLPGLVVPGADWSIDFFRDNIDAVDDRTCSIACIGLFVSLAIVCGRVFGE